MTKADALHQPLPEALEQLRSARSWLAPAFFGCAVEAIEEHYRQGHLLPLHEGRELLQEAKLSISDVLEFLPRNIDPVDFSKGTAALLGALRQMTSGELRPLDDDAHADRQALLRILRNDFETYRLKQEILNRREWRERRDCDEPLLHDVNGVGVFG